MYENDYMYAIERNPDYLAHYGIKGMRWGVRKAIESGNARRLGRQYAKAQRKLAKLEKRANNGAKYARRAAALGAGAAVAGGLAAGGTKGIVDVMGHTVRGTRAVGNAMMNASRGIHGTKLGKFMNKTGLSMVESARAGGGMHDTMAKGAKAITTWGNSNSAGKYLGKKFMDATSGNVALNNLSTRLTGVNSVGVRRALEKTSNNTIARIGAGAVGAGLAAGAGYNAYRAATTKRAARKAAEFRKAMNESFKGTKYANGAPRQGKKRRR